MFMCSIALGFGFYEHDIHRAFPILRQYSILRRIHDSRQAACRRQS